MPNCTRQSIRATDETMQFCAEPANYGAMHRLWLHAQSVLALDENLQHLFKGLMPTGISELKT